MASSGKNLNLEQWFMAETVIGCARVADLKFERVCQHVLVRGADADHGLGISASNTS